MVAARWITDTPLSERYPVYTRANAGEVLPEPVSPLGWTMVWEPGVVRGWYDCQLRLGSRPDQLEPHEVVGCFGGYLYINVSLARLFGVRAPGLSPEAVDLTYFGDHPDVPPYVPEPWHEDAEATAVLERWMGAVMSATDLPELRADRDEAERVRHDRPVLRDLPDAELVERAHGLVPTVRRMFDRHLEMTAGTAIGAGVLAEVAEAVGEPAAALSLITSIGDVDSALPSHAMWELSRLDPAGDEYPRAFERFVAAYGARGPNEWDIRSETWETDPRLAHVLVDAMRQAGTAPHDRAAEHARRREELTERFRAHLSGDQATLATFEAALRSAHLYMAGRERAKTNVVTVIHEIRMAVRELGARHGYTPSEVCMLLADELDAFVSDPSGFRPRLVLREEQYRELYDLDPPFILDGRVPPLPAWPRRTDAGRPPAAVAGDVLVGVPGCPGAVTGRARVLRHPSEPGALEPGDVLVAPVTDPAWTPLFVPAGGVVVEVGAQVSHAVIVSRELGIPCVVSVQDATRRIADGATVTVDGTAGTVTIHD